MKKLTITIVIILLQISTINAQEPIIACEGDTDFFGKWAIIYPKAEKIDTITFNDDHSWVHNSLTDQGYTARKAKWSYQNNKIYLCFADKRDPNCFNWEIDNLIYNKDGILQSVEITQKSFEDGEDKPKVLKLILKKISEKINFKSVWRLNTIEPPYFRQNIVLSLFENGSCHYSGLFAQVLRRYSGMFEIGKDFVICTFDKEIQNFSEEIQLLQDQIIVIQLPITAFGQRNANIFGIGYNWERIENEF